jgi:hypothetical protein
MDEMAELYPIHIWINEERFEELSRAGLAGASEDVLAGMRVVKLLCTEHQKDELLSRYPAAKYDAATTGSIELLPPDVKNRLFDLVVEKKSTDVVSDFLLNS